jgi:Pyridoxamine 5'-phosphate oxidase
VDLASIAPAFVEIAHRIVWATVATVDEQGRPWTRILHPIWVWEDGTLTGWVGTGPTKVKRDHLEHHPFVSATYWSPSHDTCTAECEAELLYDDAIRTEVWNRFRDGPEPVGYDPAIIPAWTSPTADTFAALKLTPWRLQVQPRAVLLENRADLRLTWQR